MAAVFAFVADAEVERDRLAATRRERRLDNRLDRREARAAGDREDRPGVRLAQVRGAVRPFDQNLLAECQLLGRVSARAGGRSAADVEFEGGLAGRVRHRVVARRKAGVRKTTCQSEACVRA